MKRGTAEIRVLHVDDEPDFADVSASYVERQNERFTVETAPSAAAAIDRLDDGAFDCVVSDYDMPGRNGIEFLEAVRETYPELPFILFTGKGGEAVASEAISAGVTDYLQKETGTEQYALLANRIRNAVERAEAERAQRRHLQAIETAREGISIIDEEGAFVYVNRVYADLYGYVPDELVGEQFDVTFPDGSLETLRSEIIPTVEQTGVWHGETTGLRADGSTFTEDHTLASTKEGELICSVWDTTERESREQAIEELHSTVRAFMRAETLAEVADITVTAVRDILDIPATSVHRYDEADDCLRPAAWTEQSEELFDEVPTFSRGDGLAWTVFERGEAGVYDDVSAEPDRLNPTTTMRSEMIVPLDDHGVLLVGSSDTDAFDDTDESLAQMLAAHATTALDGIESERDLREEREFIDQALDSLSDLFYVLETDGDLSRWNDQLTTATGYTDAELVDLDLSDLFPEGECDHVQSAISRVLSNGSATIEAELHTADGDRVPYEFTGARLTDTSGDVTGIVGMGRDISERRQRERRLERQNERFSEFASILSHDLRNPLNVAQGRLGMVDATDGHEHLDAVMRAHDRMESLIDDILTFAREGAEAAAAELVTLAAVVDDCWCHVETHEAALVAETDRTIRADRGRLQQLLENLIRNAVEHGGSDVTVTVGDVAGGFYVADDGRGISEPAGEDVLAAGYSGAPGGTGLGLNIVEQVADAHGWDIAVGESDDGGARFEFTGVEMHSDATSR